MRRRPESLLAPGSLLRQTLPAQAIASLSVAIIDLEARGIIVGPSIYCCDEHAEEHLLAIAHETDGLFRPWGIAFVANRFQCRPFAEQIVFGVAPVRPHPVHVRTGRDAAEVVAAAMKEHGLVVEVSHPLVYVRGWAADSASNA